MAAVTGTDNKTFTASAASADTVTITGSMKRLRLSNRDATNPLFFTFAAKGETPATATAGANSEYVVPPATTLDFPLVASVGYVLSTFCTSAAVVHLQSLKGDV